MPKSESKPTLKENPNAFKLWINEDIVRKYFSQTKMRPSDIQKIIAELNSLELRARVQLIAHELRDTLSDDYPKALKELMQITRKQKLKSFALWPSAEFIQIYGIEHIDISLEAMYELTQNFTAEFCIRPFINKYGIEIYQKISQWKKDPNEHIRRWLSEGTRPRLPWGEKLTLAVQKPQHGLKILEHLKFDSSLYVRKSVANHLNDIAKDHPELVVKTLSQWKKKTPKNYQKEFQFITQRALRTLIKNGHKGALQFLGVDSHSNHIKCTKLKINKTQFKVGEFLEMNFSLQNLSQKKTKYIVDYVVYFKKANGSLSPKVFKLKTGTLDADGLLNISKKHSFKPITTREYHFGEHRIALKINGQEAQVTAFELAGH